MARVHFEKVVFLKGALALDDCPETLLPEVCFMGASNVGKSSLLNALWGRKGMAHTSKQPGKTSEINFFKVDGAFVCVDLPGYGYAAVARAQKSLWEQHVSRYVEERAELKHIFLLVDARHPLKKADVWAAQWLLSLGKSFSFVQTKADKASGSDLEKNEALWKAHLTEEVPSQSVSIKQGQTMEALRKSLLACIRA